MEREPAYGFSGNYGGSQESVEERMESADLKYISQWSAKDGDDSGRAGRGKSLQWILCHAYQRTAYSQVDKRNGEGLLR